MPDDMVPLPRADLAALPKSAGHVMAVYDLGRVGDAMERSGLGPELLMEKLSAIIRNDDDPRQLPAMMFLHKYLGDVLKGSGMVAERRLTQTIGGDGSRTVVADMKVLELAAQPEETDEYIDVEDIEDEDEDEDEGDRERQPPTEGEAVAGRRRRRHKGERGAGGSGPGDGGPAPDKDAG